MPDTVIKVESLSKQYRLGTVGTGTLSHDLNRWWCKLRGKPDPYLEVTQANDRTQKGDSDYVWALRDINFEVKQGEALGIIGANGAGKSTLLKILSRVTAPTTGEVRAKGRIASLLEVGTGFHPELTGRENIFLNGAILGMTKAEVHGKLDEIVDFSGCEGYLDTPVKRYSSGMIVRLGFAVAAHLEPEILIVDEVLAVGDAEFQRRCLGKMKDVTGEGRTVLFVSHNMAAIQSLCSGALWLDRGSAVATGTAKEMVDCYLRNDAQDLLCQEWTCADHAPGNQLVRMARLSLDYHDQHQGRPIYTNTPMTITYGLWNLLEKQDINICSPFRNSAGEKIFSVCSKRQVLPKGRVEGKLHMLGDFLNDGHFSIDVIIVADGRPIFTLSNALSFHVCDSRKGSWFGKHTGHIRPVFLTFPLQHIPE
jgi:lipopolysaccharide transport system ATP-binding protein